MAVLGKRLGRFGLALHPDKTRLIPFRRPPAGQKGGKRSGDLRLPGFYALLGAKQQGTLGDALQDTQCESETGIIQSVYQWCRRHRHHSVKDQHAALTRRIQGHFNYFGVSGNFRSLLLIIEQAKRSWYKWLCRRSQRTRLTWERFEDLLRGLPAPPTPDHSSNLGFVTTSRISGGAVWWQSPCTDLARARGGLTAPGYSTAGFRLKVRV